MQYSDTVTLIFSLCGVGVLFAFYCFSSVISIKILETEVDNNMDKESNVMLNNRIKIDKEQVESLIRISNQIKSGANVFLLNEYLYMLVFIILFGTIIFFTCEHVPGKPFTTIAFVIGAFTSIICGYIGMMIATSSNHKTCYKASFSLGEAFKVAYQGGCVMGFLLVSLSISTLMALIHVYKNHFITPFSKPEDWNLLFESIAGYGLGGSSVALFCRVGGGIYTKAADVGADLVSKLELGLEEDDPANPACIADNVGDNVGDIAGMGSDLFGSLAESTCASLLVASTSSELTSSAGFLYPLLISSTGILTCIITVIIAFSYSSKIKQYESLESTIKWQMIISTLLIIPCVYLASVQLLPHSYNIGEKFSISYKENVTPLKTMVCPVCGLVLGLIVGVITEYFTSMSYSPVQNLVQGCKQGPAINIILGLALGYLSNVIPTILIGGTVFLCYNMAGMFGISLAAIGMLGNLAVCLAIDGYGPISDNAGGLASMCKLDDRIREITDDLDSAGNTTAAIGKGFAIGSACLVALSLFGAFVTNTKVGKVILNSPLVFSGLLLGAMIPYIFSAYTMEAVGNAASKMVEAIRIECKGRNNDETNKSLPDPNNCIEIATSHSLREMILPGCLVIFTPIVVGVLFGPKAVSGLLIGIIISGIQLATSSANSGGAWDNCKKSINSKYI